MKAPPTAMIPLPHERPNDSHHRHRPRPAPYRLGHRRKRWRAAGLRRVGHDPVDRRRAAELPVAGSVNANSANKLETVLPNTEQGLSFGGGAIGLQRPANNGRSNRQTIRSMDILDRPNRIGHVYGNTVRRRR